MFSDGEFLHATSLLEVKKAVKKIPLIASGGLRNGLEVAKCMALGASMCAMAYLFLLPAAESTESLFKFADILLAELKSTMAKWCSRSGRASSTNRHAPDTGARERLRAGRGRQLAPLGPARGRNTTCSRRSRSPGPSAGTSAARRVRAGNAESAASGGGRGHARRRLPAGRARARRHPVRTRPP